MNKVIQTIKKCEKMKTLANKLPKNAIMILKYIDYMGSRTQRQLHQELDLTLRALRYSLDILEKRGYIVKRPNLSDMRSLFYVIVITSQEIDEFIGDKINLLDATLEEIALSA